MNKLSTEQVAFINHHIKSTIKEKTLDLVESGVEQIYALPEELFNQYSTELNFSDFNINCKPDLWKKTDINLHELASEIRSLEIRVNSLIQLSYNSCWYGKVIECNVDNDCLNFLVQPIFSVDGMPIRKAPKRIQCIWWLNIVTKKQLDNLKEFRKEFSYEPD
jgi:hypothetical protein